MLFVTKKHVGFLIPGYWTLSFLSEPIIRNPVFITDSIDPESSIPGGINPQGGRTWINTLTESFYF